MNLYQDHQYLLEFIPLTVEENCVKGEVAGGKIEGTYEYAGNQGITLCH